MMEAGESSKLLDPSIPLLSIRCTEKRYLLSPASSNMLIE